MNLKQRDFAFRFTGERLLATELSTVAAAAEEKGLPCSQAELVEIHDLIIESGAEIVRRAAAHRDQAAQSESDYPKGGAR